MKSKGHIGKYNKLKGIHYGKAMCYSIPIRGDQVNPSYCTNWQFIAHQGITCSNLTETSKQIVTLPAVKK